MNRNRLIVIALVAVGLAAFVSFSIYRIMRVAVGNKAGVATTTVVVAAADLPVGTKLEESDLRLAQYPASDLPPGAFTAISQVVGRGVVVPVVKNEVVLDQKLAAESAGAGLPSLIPTGFRAVSVKVNDVISVAGFVTAGTRVDVILTGNPEKTNDPANITTATVLSNVQVLAAGQKLQKNDQGEPQQVTVITLLGTPEDAQKLTLASTEGRIQLSLRNPLDTGADKVAVLKNASLYRMGEAPKAAERPVRHFAKVTPKEQPSAPAPYVVEMIRGEKRDLAKF